jgi:hypothetical protein
MAPFPLVSILIPCYNAAARLMPCLQSCISQTYPQIEIILVDNNSSDDSLRIAHQVAAQCPRPIQIHTCLQPGANAARNLAFTYASGEYIQWLDADDELHPNKLALQVNALQRQPEFDIAYGDWDWLFYQNGALSHQFHFGDRGLSDMLLQCLVHHWHPPHAYLLRRACAQRLHDLQAWYPGAPIGNDREYFTTAALQGYQFVWVAGAEVRYYTWSDTQLTRSTGYFVRAEAHRQVFQRLQQRAKQRPAASLSGEHWFLLKQNWQVWRLAPAHLHQTAAQHFWVQRDDAPNGISLSATEAPVVLALHQLGGSYTLEDHAYRLVRFQLQQNQSPDQPSVIPAALPLYAPLFPETRLAILHTLDHLRGAGLLLPVREPSDLADSIGANLAP